MRNNWTIAFCVLLLAAGALAGQNRLDPQSTMHITFPEDSPLSVVSADWGESNATPRGSAMLLDLHTSLVLKNTSQRRVRAITVLVTAQDVTPGGKASVSVPSLNAGPGETFPIRIDLRLLRPVQAGSGPLVQVGLDGVLFDDLSFFGPNTLNSRRSMLVWELEARRDRRHFRSVIETAGIDALREEMVASLRRQSERGAMDARVAQSGPVTNSGSERQVQFAFLGEPNAPVRPVGGMVRIQGNEVRSPHLFLQNRSNRAVRAVEMGWMVKDVDGKQYVAGVLPVEVKLAPAVRGSSVQNATFKLTKPGGQPIAIDSLTGFVANVEFEDGRFWVPARSTNLPNLSPEEQRLAEMYRRRGLDAVVQELKRFDDGR